MTEFFDEAEADAAVHRVLARCKIIKKGRTMALFKGDDGIIYQVIQTEEVSREQLQERVDDAQEVLAAAVADLDAYDQLAPAPEEPKQPETPPAAPEPDAAAPDPAPEATPPAQPANPPATGIPPISIQ